MQVGDVYEHPVDGTRIEIVSPHSSWPNWYITRTAYPDGSVAANACLDSDESMFLGIGYIKHPAKQSSALPRWTVDDPIELSSAPDGMSCRYDSPKTPQEEEEDYRKKRDAIFARMFS